ncbi:MAG: hypothetical protein GY788_11615 [bacterium]|nr:hypothetical protein [bacterium]
MTFGEMRDVIEGGTGQAIVSSEQTLSEQIDSFQESERRKEPVYLGSWALIVIGTVMTIL